MEHQFRGIAARHHLEFAADLHGQLDALPLVELETRADVERLAALTDRIAFAGVHRQHDIGFRAVIRRAVFQHAARALEAEHVHNIGEFHDCLSAPGYVAGAACGAYACVSRSNAARISPG